MASFAGESVWRGLVRLLRRQDQPDAPTLEERIGKEWDALAAGCRDFVEQSGGKACSGKITIELKVKAYRTQNGEVALDIAPSVAAKIPNAPLPARQVFLDREAVAHTQPVQVDLPIMGIRGTVDGGKDTKKDEQDKKGKAI